MDATPPSMALEPRQTSPLGRFPAWARSIPVAVEAWLEEEREQLALWAPVALGAGIAAWFALPDPAGWLSFCCAMLALACGACLVPEGMRLRKLLLVCGLLATAGCLLVWGKAAWSGTPPLARPVFAEMAAEVEAVQAVPAQKMVRLLVRPEGRPDLPERVRVNLDEGHVPEGLGRGALVRFRARLMPPAPPAVPGGYDFAQRAYFLGIGATGRALAPVTVLRAAKSGPTLRARLFDHILHRVDGHGAGIAAAFATGDQGAISEADAEAMRRSGLAHLLSISGLHVTALIGAVIFLLLKLMALNRWAALHWPLMLIAAAGGALAGIGYTLLTGAEVPTVRSCVAALLVLGGLAMGRDAITLRLVAAGALVVLLVWPEALVGPSFQMSFAAVIAIVALAEHRRFRSSTAARDEAVWRKGVRAGVAALATGAAVELVLAPIALFHFHQAGMLGAFANLLAIPLTTFVVMPLEAVALLLDIVGLGAPFWWLVGHALDLLLMIAHGVAASPMAVVMAPAHSGGVFTLIVLGGLWGLLWRTRWRWLGLLPVTVGMGLILTASPPEILVTGDGRHVAVRTPGGGMAILRDRAGDYVRDTLSESAGHDGDLAAIATLPGARCSTDLCAVRLRSGRGDWQLLATRSAMLVDRPALEPACAQADIVVSDRRLPFWCRPRWFRADGRLLARTGGLAIDLESGTVRTVLRPGDRHPWIPAQRSRRGRYPSRPRQL